MINFLSVNNFPSESLFFNIDAYEVGYFSNYRGLGEEMKRYMYIAANNVDDRSVWYSKQITCADVSLRIKFSLPVCLNRDSQIEQMSVFALKSIRYTISLKQDGSVLYYAGSGTWQVDEKILEKTYDISASETEFVEQIGMIRVDRSFPVQIYVEDAQYVWRELDKNVLPETSPSLPFFNNLLKNKYCGISNTEWQFNRICRQHFDYNAWLEKKEYYF